MTGISSAFGKPESIESAQLDVVARVLSRNHGDRPMLILAVEAIHSLPGRDAAVFDTVGGCHGIEVRMGAALALHLLTDAIAGYQAEAMRGTPPNPSQLERLKAAAAILAPDGHPLDLRHGPGRPNA